MNFFKKPSVFSSTSACFLVFVFTLNSALVFADSKSIDQDLEFLVLESELKPYLDSQKKIIKQYFKRAGQRCKNDLVCIKSLKDMKTSIEESLKKNSLDFSTKIKEQIKSEFSAEEIEFLSNVHRHNAYKKFRTFLDTIYSSKDFPNTTQHIKIKIDRVSNP